MYGLEVSFMTYRTPLRAGLMVGLTAAALSLGGMVSASEHSLDHLAIEVLAGGCAGCHGTDGALTTFVPSIAGRPAEVLESQLLRYKHGPSNATVMNRIAAGFSDDDLRRLAAHFANK